METPALLLALAMAVMIASSLFPGAVARLVGWPKVSKRMDEESIP
jgi:hypothetical protein